MLAIAWIALALAPQPHDTLVTMPEVVVTATRLPTERSWSPSAVTLRALGGPLAVPAASAGTAVAGMPGLILREYGGPGAVQTISVRGTGSEQSLVLMDGVPITNRESGLTDLSVIPAFLLEGAELRRGGGSSLFGSEAVGGVLNLSTRSVRPEPTLELFGSTGAFGGSSGGVTVDQPISPGVGLAAGLEAASFSGDYPFSPSGGSQIVRLDNDMRSLSAYTMVQMNLGNSLINKSVISFASSDKGAPGPVQDVLALPVARQAESHLYVSDAFQTRLAESLRLMLGLSGQDSWLRYVDPAALVPVDNYYRNQSLFAAPALEVTLGEAEHVISGAELGLDRASGNALDGVKERRHAGWFLSSSLGPYVVGGPAVSAFPSARLDFYDGFGPVASAGLGLSLGSSPRSPGVLLHASAGNIFRAPTFNELYYAGGGGLGNPGLGAERSTSIDGGVTFRKAAAGWHELDITAYRIETRDRIIWLPLGSPFVWTAENVGTTRTWGVEISYDWKIVPERLSVSAHYATIDAQRIASNDPTAGNQLPFVPLDEGALEANARFPFGASTLSLELADRYTGVRYTSEDASASLSGNHVIDIGLAVQAPAFGSKVTLGYALRNATDLDYQLMPRYPMPPRNHQLTLRVGHTF